MKVVKNGRKKMSIWHLMMLAVVAMGLITVSCYRDYGLGVEDYDSILTLYDKSLNFKVYQTYAMPDTILHLLGEDEEDNLSRIFDSQILADVARNMQNLGYTRVEVDTTKPAPDLVILVSAASQEWTGWSYYPGWGWWGGGGWWGWAPGWGGYYPGYAVPYQYETGTLFIEMYDPLKTKPDNDQRAEVIWGGTINGLLSGTTTGTSARLTRNINQAFSQSPYLNVK